MPHTQYGAVNFVQRDGTPAPTSVGYGPYGLFVAEVLMLGMTYLYHGEKEFGLELARRCWQNLVCRQRLTWDIPAILDGQTGAVFNGNDYYQAMMLWSLPAVLAGQNLSGPCQPGGLVDRIIEAGAAKRQTPQAALLRRKKV